MLPPLLILAIIFLLNVLGLFLFIRIARKRSIIDAPNERSSHTVPTVRGGGLYFAPTFIGLICLYFPAFYWSAVAIFLAAAVSFVDDLQNLSVRWRLLAHLLAVSILIIDTQGAWPLWAFALAIILITGWLNTFNFMDGINGITTVYGGVFLFFLFLVSQDSNTILSLKVLNEPSLALGMLPAILAFAFFNFRKKALCFAGDIGSVSLALIIAWSFLQLWTGPESLYLLTFPAIYAVDSVMTILLRLLKGKNIFEAHRSHLYQLLANECAWDHRLVAMLYGGLQAIINIVCIYTLADANSTIQLMFLIALYVVLCLIYFLARKVVALRLAPSVSSMG